MDFVTTYECCCCGHNTLVMGFVDGRFAYACYSCLIGYDETINSELACWI